VQTCSIKLTPSRMMPGQRHKTAVLIPVHSCLDQRSLTDSTPERSRAIIPQVERCVRSRFSGTVRP